MVEISYLSLCILFTFFFMIGQLYNEFSIALKIIDKILKFLTKAFPYDH